MNKKVWKFYLTPGYPNRMPKGAEILTVKPQGDYVCLWALVDPDAPREDRWFSHHGTGYTVVDADNLKYVGSCHWERTERFQLTSWVVIHVFEDLKP